MKNKKPKRVKSLRELSDAKPLNDNHEGWEERYAYDEEIKYLKLLKDSKDVLKYREEREEEVFLDNL